MTLAARSESYLGLPHHAGAHAGLKSIKQINSQKFEHIYQPRPNRHTAMTPPLDIQASAPVETQRKSVSHSYDQNFSTSPTATFHSPPPSWGGQLPRRSAPKQLKPFNTQDIKILLLENVNQTGRDILVDQGYQVESFKSSLPEDQLIEKIR